MIYFISGLYLCACILWSLFVLKMKDELTNNKISICTYITAFLSHTIFMPISMITAIQIVRIALRERTTISKQVIVGFYDSFNTKFHYRGCTIVIKGDCDPLQVIKQFDHKDCCFVCDKVNFTDLDNGSCLMSKVQFKLTI